MKPFAKKLSRIPCPRCGEANLNVVIKGSIGAKGKIEKAIKEVNECPICHYSESKNLTTEKLKKVELQTTNESMQMQVKSMYEIKARRSANDQEWCLIEWKGSWRDKETMQELGSALAEACRTTRMVGEDEVIESGYYLDNENGKRRLFILSSMLDKFEDVVGAPLFQEAFTPWARISDDQAQAISDAFKDVK